MTVVSFENVPNTCAPPPPPRPPSPPTPQMGSAYTLKGFFPKESKFFLIRVDLFSEGRQTIVTGLSSSECLMQVMTDYAHY